MVTPVNSRDTMLQAGSRTAASTKNTILSASPQVFSYNAAGALSPTTQTVAVTVLRINTVQPIWWSTSPTVPLYDAAAGGSTINQASTSLTNVTTVYLRSADFGTNLSVQVQAVIQDISAITSAVVVLKQQLGATTATLQLYQSVGIAPAAPTSIGYTPSTGVYTGLGSWLASQPITSTAGLPTYLTSTTISTNTPTVAVTGMTWTNPVVVAQNSPTTYLLELFSVGSISVPNAANYTISSNVLGGTFGAWTLSQPSSSTTPTYMTTALISTNTPATAYNVPSWSAPVIVAQQGANGVTSYLVQLYNNTGATVPGSLVTYTISTGFLGGSGFTGWSLSQAALTSTATQMTSALVVTSTPSSPASIASWSAGITVAQTGLTGNSNYRVYIAANIGSIPATPGTTTSGATPALWSSIPVVLGNNQAQYQSDGVMPSNSTTTTWNAPYQSYLKIGNLEALGVSTGALSVDGTLTIGTNGNIVTSGGGYSGTGVFLGYHVASNTYRFSVGSSLTYDGANLTIGAITISGGAIGGIGTGTGTVVDNNHSGIQGQITTAGTTATWGGIPAGTGKAADNATAGTVLNTDPFCTDLAKWTGAVGSYSLATITDGVAGTKTFRNLSGGYPSIVSNSVPADASKVYRVRAHARKQGTADGTFYLAAVLFDSAGTAIGGDGIYWFYPAAGVTLSSGWTEYSGIFGAGQSRTLPANARFVAVGLFLHYGGTTGWHEVQGIRLEDVSEAYAASLTATWGGVSGTGRPADNATVGARAGTNLLDAAGTVLTDANVKNIAITVNANGTLSGAGSGAVTIGGLGYSGALNANYTTNTNQLTDDANLGQTANYGNLSGTPGTAIANSSVYLTTTGGLGGAGGGQITTIPVIDNGERETNRAPSYYQVGTIKEFKHASAIGLSDGDGYWLTLETIKQYAQSSGGYPGYQYAYQQAKTWRRRSVDDAGSAWTAWAQDLDTNAYTGALNATANQSDATTNAAISNRLNKLGADTMVGPISLTAVAAILVGTTSDGLYLGNTGLIGRKAGVTTFSISNSGSATFAGSLSGSTIDGVTGSFSGTLAAGVISTSELFGESHVFTTAGSYSQVVPTALSSMKVTVTGGGGGGGAGGGGGTGGGGGAGGGGGTSITTFTVTPGSTITLTVGAGGAGGSTGGTSTVNAYLAVVGGNPGGAGTYGTQSGDNSYYPGGSGGGGGVGATGNGVAGSSGSQGYAGAYNFKSGNWEVFGYPGAGSTGGGNSYLGTPGKGGNGGYNGAAGATGTSGKITLEFFNPNSVVIRSEYNTLISALQRQNIQTV